MDPRRAVGEQVGALQRRVGDAEVGHRVRLVGAQLELAQQLGGIDAPHMPVIRLICPKSVTGMIPGMIGTSMPVSRARATNS